MNKIIICIIIISSILFAGDPLFVTGRQLVGSYVNEQSIREVIGNVVVKQGNVTITCDRAIQNITKNTVEMLGNVVITQNNKVLSAPYVFYNGNTRIAEAKQNVKLIDGNIILKSNRGNYNYKDQTAFFYDNVKLISDEKVLTCNYLSYYSNEGKAIAQENVTLVDSTYRIKANQIIYYRLTKNALAKEKVEVYDQKDNSYLYCNTLEYYHIERKAYFYDNPYFISYRDNDTILIKARRIEVEKLSITNVNLVDSVHMFYGVLYSFSNFVNIKNNDTITLSKYDNTKPVIIYNQSQFISDTIKIYKNKNIVNRIDFIKNSLIIEKIKIGEYRYNQVSSDNISVYFENNKPKLVDLINKVLGYYYIIEQDTIPNGVVKISADYGKIIIDSAKISDIKLYNDVQSDYFPENKIVNNEKEFFLYNFEFFEQKYYFLDVIKRLKRDYSNYF
ncbi:MAG TPA: OstA-like protein [Ignavibacteriales bacterium]|nr:OstA-like protein [Ignavibacteriales bacterium]HOL81626.1 OstA-like protein [Ignavibacteriales bacterium]HOM65193.1 OstA-like protein [Ignavibacteriales bacterium]HPD66917.1 OstA-like protein [Ignavibacteriales bacterium]HPP33740.1 OstA-like protein [Ignavibacteriales bacterium]